MILLLALLLLLAPDLAAQSNRGYYRYPAIHGNTIVFTAEGDLWQVGTEGGAARRLTTHAGEESRAAFSPDGKTIAFSANYEGPTEVYTMPASGGLPSRRTFEGAVARVVGWTPTGKVLYSTNRHSTLPDTQLATIDTQNTVELVPLSQAAHGSYDAASKTLFFTRLPFQGSHAKRYKGGTAQKLWKFAPGAEAVPLTTDYTGTSKEAMWWNGRVYFASDRDGTMNLWSMDENGRNLKQHTRHQDWDVQMPSLSQGRIVYKLGADLRLYDIASAGDKLLPIELTSDFDHLRERWVKQPNEYGISINLSHDGSRLVLVSRGKVFVSPIKQGRFVEATAQKPARFRSASMTADGESLIVLSTESGEVEVWKIPANGTGPGERLTTGASVLRWDAISSPDGKWIAHQDKDNQLWLLDAATKTEKKIMTGRPRSNSLPAFAALRWSPDSRWLTFGTESLNIFQRLYLYSVENGALTALTTDRYNNAEATWSRDGKWIYFLSDRALKSVVTSPFGVRQPDPYFDRSLKIYQLALRKGLRSPFEPPDELNPDKPADTPKPAEKPEAGSPKPAAEGKKPEPAKVEVDLDGLAARILKFLCRLETTAR